MFARDCVARWRSACLAALVLGVAGCTQPTTYVTEHGLGPDKWATAWLLTQLVDPGSELKVVPIGASLPTGTPFDVPGAPILRQGTQSAFEVAGRALPRPDGDFARMARIVHDIEIGAWGAASDPDSPIVEHGFRSLQQRYGRDKVPPECYVRFFGDVHTAIRHAREEKAPISAERLATDCDGIAADTAPKIVAEVSIDHLLGEMRRGKRVAFVDVREADEFAEAHIPGALNIPIRDKSQAVSQVQDADYVVSYCIKDFRGFEMAKALKDAGVANSVILNPYGIRGWVEEGLPTVGSKALTPPEGQARLTECVESPEACRATPLARH